MYACVVVGGGVFTPRVGRQHIRDSVVCDMFTNKVRFVHYRWYFVNVRKIEVDLARVNNFVCE